MPTLVEQAVDSLRHVVESAGAFVSGDPLRLHQVIANLVTNAIKLTLPGGRIEVRMVRASASPTTERALRRKPSRTSSSGSARVTSACREPTGDSGWAWPSCAVS